MSSDTASTSDVRMSPLIADHRRRHSQIFPEDTPADLLKRDLTINLNTPRIEQRSSRPHSGASELHDLPTVAEHQPFDPRSDAEVLYEAMKGLGTQEDVIIDVLAKRTSKQRKDIAYFYREQYGKELLKAFRGELKILLSGHFDDVITALFKSPAEYDAELIHHAITGLSTDIDALVDIVCSRTHVELQDIRTTYKSQYHKELVQDIEGHVHTSAMFKKLIVEILTLERDAEDGTVDEAQAKWDACALFDISPKNWGKSGSDLVPIFAGRSFAHLRLVFNEFEKLADMPMASVLGHDLHGDLSNLFQHIVHFVKDKDLYFTQMLHRALTGVTVNHKVLMRVIISRSEIDLGTIKKQFQKNYHKSLASLLESHTTGLYRNILMALNGYPQIRSTKLTTQ